MKGRLAHGSSTGAADVQSAREVGATGGCAWIDGEYVPIAEARISILDTGFIRSDLTYEVVAVSAGRFFRLDDHLDRLERSCRAIRLEPPLPRERMREIVIEVVRRSAIRDAYVGIIITRGVPAPGQRGPIGLEPRLYVYAIPYVWILNPEDQETGGELVIARDVRRIPPDAINPTVKNFQWGDFIRGQFEAFDRGGRLALLTDGDGNATEGGGFNVFAVVDRALHTPARGVLEGITRKSVLEIAAEEGIETHVEELPTELLRGAQELFVTSTAGGVMPVSTLDGAPVGDGTPGPVTRLVRERYWAWHDDPRFTTDVGYDA